MYSLTLFSTDLVLNPIKNDLVSKVNIWSQNDNKFNLVKGKFGSERTKKSDDWNASEKTKNSDSENLKKILKNETFHSKVLKRNWKLNELKGILWFISLSFPIILIEYSLFSLLMC